MISKVASFNSVISKNFEVGKTNFWCAIHEWSTWAVQKEEKLKNYIRSCWKSHSITLVLLNTLKKSKLFFSWVTLYNLNFRQAIYLKSNLIPVRKTSGAEMKKNTVLLSGSENAFKSSRLLKRSFEKDIRVVPGRVEKFCPKFVEKRQKGPTLKLEWASLTLLIQKKIISDTPGDERVFPDQNFFHWPANHFSQR